MNVTKKIQWSSDKIFGVEMGLLNVFILPVGVSLGLFFLTLWVIFPRFEEIRQTISEIGKTGATKKTLDTRKSWLLGLDEEGLKKMSGTVESALLREKNAYYVVGIVRNVAAKHEYMIQSFSVSIGKLSGGEEKEEKSYYAKIPVTLELNGPREKYLDLIKSLERSLPLLSLESFEQRVTGGVAELRLVISAYYIQGANVVDLTKLDLNQLDLKKEEMDVINELRNFELVGGLSGLDMSQEEKKYVKYERKDPFSF